MDIGAYEFQGTGSVISYAWLQQYGLPTDGSADYADPDGDGLNNWQEWRCGTDPTNALSALRLLSAPPTGTNVTVSWQSVAGVNYFLERSTNLALAVHAPGHEHPRPARHDQLHRHQRHWRWAVLLPRGRSGSLRHSGAVDNSADSTCF